MAETPAARLFSLLEVLQARPAASGAELAELLGVTTRTLRRYVQRLVDLGIPVESERGPYGGYRLLPGYRLPPLMFSSEEAIAVTLGLLMAGRLGVSTAVPAASSALAKLQRVLPADVRQRVRALEGSIDVTPAAARAPDVDPQVLMALGAAAAESRRVTLRYRTHQGASSERTIDPYGVVFHAGRWYLAGHDHVRGQPRTYRIDRVSHLGETPERFRRPDGFDAVDHVVRSLASVPYGWDVEVVLHTELDHARWLVPPTVGTVEEHPQGALLRVGAASPEWAARHLVSLGVPFTVLSPDELRVALRDLAGSVAALAESRLDDRG